MAYGASKNDSATIPAGGLVEFIGRTPDQNHLILRYDNQYALYGAFDPDIKPPDCEVSLWGVPSPTYLSLTEVISRTGITAWHEAGYLGDGVRVGVIDTRFDELDVLIEQLSIPMEQFTFVDPLETMIDLHPAAERTDSHHGTNVVEVLATIAPRAHFVVARSTDAASFQQTVDALIAQNVQIIVHAGNVITPHPTPYHEAIQRATEEHDILWVNSAGNMGVGYYPGRYSGGGGLLPIHQFADPNRTGLQQSLMVPVDRSRDVTVTAIWNAGLDDAYEFELIVSGNCRLDATETFAPVTSQRTEDTPPGMARVTISTGQLTQIGDYNTVPASGEQFACTNTANPDGVADHHIFISLRDANQNIPVDTRFDLYVQGAISATFDPYTMVSLDPVVQTPADIISSFTVGSQSTSEATLAWYSGRSNSLQYYELNSFDVDYSEDEHVQPNLVTYGEIILPSGREFLGTSASAPVVGGIAALVLTEIGKGNVDRTYIQQLRTVVSNSATCLENSGTVTRILKNLVLPSPDQVNNQNVLTCSNFTWQSDIASSLNPDYLLPEILIAEGDAEASNARTESIRLASLADQELQFSKHNTAALLAIQALEIAYTPEADGILMRAIDGFRGIASFETPGITNTLLAVSPDSTQFLSGGEDGIVFLWNLETETITDVIRPNNATITSATFSGDGTLLVLGSVDGTACILRLSTSVCEQLLIGHYASIEDVEFDSTGLIALTASADGVIKIWDTGSGDLLANLGSRTEAVQREIQLDISLDGQVIMTNNVGAGGVNIWSRRTGEIIHSADVDAEIARLSPDGQSVIVLHDTVISRWDLNSEEITVLGEISQMRVVTDLDLSSDGSQIAITGTRNVPTGTFGYVMILDGQTGEELLVSAGHDSTILGVRFLPEGNKYLSFDSTFVWLWSSHGSLVQK
ncbi:MAG: S8 family serine peptidase [Anaerolineae bacterium]|nr:S8 family serine peptidase [Anaerolineae bacterium]